MNIAIKFRKNHETPAWAQQILLQQNKILFTASGKVAVGVSRNGGKKIKKIRMLDIELVKFYVDHYKVQGAELQRAQNTIKNLQNAYNIEGK